MNSLPRLDSEGLREVIAGESGLFQDLLAHYKATSERCLGVMENASEDAAWQKAAHEWAGASVTMRLLHLAELCRRAECQPISMEIVQSIQQEYEVAMVELEALTF